MKMDKLKMRPETYIVIARDDRLAEMPGAYSLCTRTVFETEPDAIAYAASIPSHREPMVIPGDFEHLRFDTSERFGRCLHNNSFCTHAGCPTQKDCVHDDTYLNDRMQTVCRDCSQELGR